MTSRIPGIPDGIELSEPRRKPDNRFTYRHYKHWPDDERWEIIRGKAFDITDSPGVQHQRILQKLLCALTNQLPNDHRHLLMGPFDALLNLDGRPPDRVDSIVQPGILYTRHSELFYDLYFMGIPDFLIEVVCPWRVVYELRDKLGLYAELKVPECWMIHPEEGWLLQQRLVGKTDLSLTRFFSVQDELSPICLPDVTIRLADILPPSKPQRFRLKTEMIDGRPLRDS